MDGILQVSSVRKSYGDLQVLTDVSFSAVQGEIFAIIGPNGAGKTTLFNVMTGEAGSSAGSVRVKGIDVTGTDAFQRVRLGVGRTFQVARVFGDMTATENVVVAVESRLRSKGERVRKPGRLRPRPEVLDEASRLLGSIGLSRCADAFAGLLSHGDKKRLELAMVLGLQPSILMLDEPTAGMSPSDRMAAAALITSISRETGMTVVMTEHDMDVVFSMADRLLVLNYGCVVAIGSVDAVRANPQVKEIYLGQEMYSDA